MSSTYIVQSGDVLGKIFQQAHNRPLLKPKITNPLLK